MQEPCVAGEKTEGDPGLDEEEAGKGRSGRSNIQVALPHQLHLAQHRLLGALR